jgi:hypothetical protein
MGLTTLRYLGTFVHWFCGLFRIIWHGCTIFYWWANGGARLCRISLL